MGGDDHGDAPHSPNSSNPLYPLPPPPRRAIDNPGGGIKGPTLLDEMLTAAAATTAAKSQPNTATTTTTTFGSGLKAGFLTARSKTSCRSRSSTMPKPPKTAAAVPPRPTSNDLQLHRLLAASSTLHNALQQPRNQHILAELGQNASATLTKYQSDAEAMAFLKELMDVLGQNFEELGLKEPQHRQQQQPEQGPLLQAALAKHPHIQPIQDPAQDKKEREAADRILGDTEVRELLLDAEMQRVLHECTQGGSGAQLVQQYPRDPTMAAKLRKLAAAGLIQFEETARH